MTYGSPLARQGAASDRASAAEPTPTWEKYCYLGPPPAGWDSWETFIEYGRSIIDKYGPPPTLEPVAFDQSNFQGPPPLGYDSWQEFSSREVAVQQEIQASGGEAQAACTGKPVCVQTSFGPVWVAPPGEGVQLPLGGDECPARAGQ